MMLTETDRETASVLVIALQHAGLQLNDVVARIDAELVARSDPDPWLAEASLARSCDDLLSILKEVAGTHPLLGDPLAVFEVLATVRERRTVPTERVVRFVLGCWYDGTLPADLEPLVHDVYEDGFCAHEYDSVQPELAERAIATFLVAARGRSGVSSVVARVADAGWV